MTRVSVLVPFRPDGGHRDRAWEWVRDWWMRTHPGWQVVEGNCPRPDSWVKALAVADALQRADGDLLVIADADVVCPDVEAAVQVVEDGAPWAIPHNIVYRFSEHATARLYVGVAPEEIRGGWDRKPYRGVEGGGLVVLPRETYGRVPLDPRFTEWGQEDESWAIALNMLAGRRWRGAAPLFHLWHPPAPRLNRHVGNPHSWALHVRYAYAAKAGASAMRVLIDEFARREELTR